MKYQKIQLYDSRFLLSYFLINLSKKKLHFHPTIILSVDNKYPMKETAEHAHCLLMTYMVFITLLKPNL